MVRCEVRAAGAGRSWEAVRYINYVRGRSNKFVKSKGGAIDDVPYGDVEVIGSPRVAQNRDPGPMP
jgi:hypothetical protein